MLQGFGTDLIRNAAVGGVALGTADERQAVERNLRHYQKVERAIFAHI
jgi:hypothetical protein